MGGGHPRVLRPRGWPWWLQVLGVYAASRVWAAVVLLVVAQTQAATPWTPAAPTYAQYTGLMWDGDWYRQIAEHGYPDSLPRAPDGQVLQNAWAFHPLFPVLVRTVMALTSGPWEVVAPTLSLVLGAAAMLVVHRLVARVAGPRRWLPLATVTLVATFPAAPVLQVAYTESLALLLIAAALLLVLDRHYLWAVPVVLALGFTRAVALPVALVVVAHAVTRWRQARRGAERWGPGEPGALALLAGAAVVAGVAWQVVAAAVTGEADAYLQTQGAWRARPVVPPVLPWVDVAQWLFGRWGPVVLVLALGGLAALLLSAPLRGLGVELHTWVLGYIGYLVLVVEPGTSLVRFLLLAFPVAAAVAGTGARPDGDGRLRPARTLPVLVLLGALLMAGWVATLWRLVPPSGWPP